MNSEPRTQGANEAGQSAAYRRLAAVMLRLDVATLARELKMRRMLAEAEQPQTFAHAA